MLVRTCLVAFAAPILLTSLAQDEDPKCKCEFESNSSTTTLFPPPPSCQEKLSFAVDEGPAENGQCPTEECSENHCYVSIWITIYNSGGCPVVDLKDYAVAYQLQSVSDDDDPVYLPLDYELECNTWADMEIQVGGGIAFGSTFECKKCASNGG